MSVTTLIDVDLLDSAYQLNAYHGLRHPVENDEIVSTGCKFYGHNSTYMYMFFVYTLCTPLS